MDREQKDLYFPVNVIDRNDFIQGFGGKEFAIAGIAFAIAVTAIIFLYVSTGNMMIAIFAGVSILTVTLILIRRDKFDESIIDKGKYVMDYYKQQHQFTYNYYNIYEGRYASEYEEK